MIFLNPNQPFKSIVVHQGNDLSYCISGGENLGEDLFDLFYPRKARERFGGEEAQAGNLEHFEEALDPVVRLHRPHDLLRHFTTLLNAASRTNGE